MATGGRDNGLDALRLLAALLVVVGHSYALLGLGRVPRILGIPLDQFGVYVFFAISGYLIAASWNAQPKLGPFLAKRALRIFPALVVVILVTTFLLGPLVTRLPLGDYFGSAETWWYLSGISLIPAYFLPGVFDVGHHTAAVNGSLWTLGIEFTCYLAVALAGLALRRYAALGYGVLLLVAVMLLGSPAQDFGRTVAFFAVGALLFRLAPPGLLRPGSLIATLPLWGVGAMMWPAVALQIAWLFLPLVVLTVGLARVPGIRHVGRFGDLSYGMYLWGFPVQQLCIEYVPGLPQWLNLLIVIPSTAVIAYASWHLVEKHALAHKPMLRAAPIPPPPTHRSPTGMNRSGI